MATRRVAHAEAAAIGLREIRSLWEFAMTTQARDVNTGSWSGALVTVEQGIKRRLTVLDWTCQGTPERAWRTWPSDAFVPQSVLTCRRVPRISCHISCQTSPGPFVAASKTPEAGPLIRA